MSKKIIMSWSKCTIREGASTGTKTMPSSLTAIGIIADKTCNLESSDGEELKGVATGGIVVAYEQLEGACQITFRVKEPEDACYERYGLGEEVTDEFGVKTHVVATQRAIEVAPKNVGATGIKAPICFVKFKPGRNETDGDYVDITYFICPVLDDNYEVEAWYYRFKKEATVPQG